MKVNIEVEQFDNGITVIWQDADGQEDPEAIVALDKDKEAAIGKLIWYDIKKAMDAALANKVKMEVTYLVCYEEEKP